jgi:hypothetical protein
MTSAAQSDPTRNLTRRSFLLLAGVVGYAVYRQLSHPSAAPPSSHDPDQEFLHALSTLPENDARSLATLAADLLPVEALRLTPAAIANLRRAEAETLQTHLEDGLPPQFKAALQELEHKSGTSWHLASRQQRSQILSDALRDPVGDPYPATPLRDFLLGFRNALETVFWRHPAVHERVLAQSMQADFS